MSKLDRIKEKLKASAPAIKSAAKRHAPTVIASAIAVYYGYRFNQVNKYGVVMWMDPRAKQAWYDDRMVRFNGEDDNYTYTIQSKTRKPGSGNLTIDQDGKVVE